MGLRVGLIVGLFLGILSFGLLLPQRVNAAPMAVINGADVPVGEQSWVVGILQAAVEDDYLAQFCGGTLIDTQWVLTAAHCTFDEQGNDFQPTDLHVLAGRRALRSTEGMRLAVDKIIRHPAFDTVTYSNDIALLHLAEATTIAPVQLVDLKLDAPLLSARQAMVVGWGVTKDGAGANILQRAQVPMVSTATCQKFYTDYGVTLDPTMLCAGYEQGGIDACTGDSGGPLLVWHGHQQAWVQIGIISWGSGCAEVGVYGVYTQVAGFIEWIEGTVGGRETVGQGDRERLLIYLSTYLPTY